MFTVVSAVLYPIGVLGWWTALCVTRFVSKRAGYQLSELQLSMIISMMAYGGVPGLIVIGFLVSPTQPLSSGDIGIPERVAVMAMITYFFHDISRYARRLREMAVSELIHHSFLGWVFMLAYENDRLERGMVLGMVIMADSVLWWAGLFIKELPDGKTLHWMERRAQIDKINLAFFVVLRMLYFPCLSVYLIKHHVDNWPDVSTEDCFYLLGVPMLNVLDLGWLVTRIKLVQKSHKRVNELRNDSMQQLLMIKPVQQQQQQHKQNTADTQTEGVTGARAVSVAVCE